MHARRRPPWHALLVGGASGSGKTRVSAELAAAYRVPVVAIDDLHAAVLATTTPDDQPDLHVWTSAPDPFALSEDEIFELHRAVCRALEPAIHAVVADRVDAGTPVIVEGDYLLPESADRILRAHPGVDALFVIEPDEARLAANLARREAGDHTGRARVSTRLNARHLEECVALGIPWVPARPWSDVATRAIAAASACPPR